MGEIVSESFPVTLVDFKLGEKKATAIFYYDSIWDKIAEDIVKNFLSTVQVSTSELQFVSKEKWNYKGYANVGKKNYCCCYETEGHVIGKGDVLSNVESVKSAYALARMMQKKSLLHADEEVLKSSIRICKMKGIACDIEKEKNRIHEYNRRVYLSWLMIFVETEEKGIDMEFFEE